MTRSKGSKCSNYSSGSIGQSDWKFSGRKHSDHDPSQSYTTRRNYPPSNGRVQQRLEGSNEGDDCDDGWQWRMAAESGNLRESHQLSNATPPSNQEHTRQLQKREGSPVDIGRWLKFKTGLWTAISADQEIIPEQACEVAPHQYIDNVHNMWNDDQQKLVS
ncbi:hypothetical protein BDD12DRAFT_801406 [Trichophaea hybrida]|nr:hypothetical protein BDD12DRAFT_801406 [Trichophaea hybrida]